MHYFTWAEIDGMVRLLADQISERSIDCIVGISRSGLIPAVMLSHFTGIRDLSVIDIARTTSDSLNAQKNPPAYRGFLNAHQLHGRKVLVVDDIVGNGLTMRMAFEMTTAVGASPTLAALVVNQQNLGTTKPEEVVQY